MRLLAIRCALAVVASTPCLTPAWAQAPVTFAQYLEAVEAHSLDLQAQHENVTSARAGVSIAGVRPDPLLTAGVASKELLRAAKTSTATELTAGIAITIETAGKRGARIRNAEGNVAQSQAAVEQFRQQMQLDAAAAFSESCRAKAVLARMQSSLAAFRDTVRVNELRLKAGDIGMLELRQSRVEADRFAADVTSASASAEVAVMNLSGPLGERFDTVFGPARPDCLPLAAATPPPIDELIREAMGARRDILLAQAAVESARANTALVRSNRWVDPVVNVGLTNTPRIPPIFDNAGATVNSPAEHSLALGVTVTVPIPISRLQDGEIRQAESALTQAMLQYRSTVLRAEIDVQSTHAIYRGALQNVQRYESTVLQEADKVLEGTRLSYRKGSASLLDLLNAQRTADDVHLGYLQALADLADATAKLQLSTGRKVTL